MPCLCKSVAKLRFFAESTKYSTAYFVYVRFENVQFENGYSQLASAKLSICRNNILLGE